MSVGVALRLGVRRLRNRAQLAGLLVRERGRLRRLAGAPSRSGVHVYYGRDRLPTLDEPAGGGMVKFQHLAERLPNTLDGFTVLYLGSSTMPLDAAALVRVARRRGAAFAWNQNGVAYPGWHGPGWELENAPRASLLREADHVVYQSAFCKVAADRWYGEPAGPWEVLHNPVDTTLFAPAARREDRPFTLLLGGSQYQWYRVETALRTLRFVVDAVPGARLIVTGALSFLWGRPEDARRRVDALVDGLGLAGSVELVGPYTQREAPALLARADVLLHTKVNDPCPTVVLEAMACGLPVAHSATGGTPELVGDAGVGVTAPLDWERDRPPAPDELAGAVLRIRDGLADYSAAARARAVERFDLQPWVERHRRLFEELAAT